ELIGAPVYAESVPSTASFPASHPLFRGAMVRLAHAVRAELEQHDLLLSIGGDLFTWSLPSPSEPIPPPMPILHLHRDPWALGKNYPEEVAILGAPKGTLPELSAAVRERMTSGARARAGERLEAAKKATLAERAALKAKARAAAGAVPVQPLALLEAIGDMPPKDAVVIDEAGSASGRLRQLVASDDPQSFFGLRGGGIGWGLPA